MKRNESTETAVSSECDWSHTNKMLYKWIIRNVLQRLWPPTDVKGYGSAKIKNERSNYNLKDYFYWREPQMKKMAQLMFNSWGLFG